MTEPERPGAARSPVRFRVLGPVAADGATGPLRVGGPKRRGLLAVLLLHANREVADERLCALLWGDHPPANARGQLQVYVSGLRGLLGKAAVVRESRGYRLVVAPGELDLEVFTGLVGRGVEELARGRAAAASEALREALALWRGPALGGVPESLVAREGPALQERRVVAFEHFAEAQLALGGHAGVIGELTALVREHPLRERLTWQLMVALSRAGRVPEALAAYDAFRRGLAVEQGLDPGDALVGLHRSILQGREAGPRPAELPHDVPGFAGRERELAELTGWLEEWERAGGVRVCVVSGMPGVGKSALAVHWAHRVRDRFPDGQLYLDLRDPGDPVARLLRTVEPHGRGTGEPDRRYRTAVADRRFLLLLDHAEDAAQVRRLLPGGSAVVVVTSRNRLGDLVVRDGARALPLDVLAVGDSLEVLGERGAAAEELAELCGHLPLALRIAAADPGGAARWLAETPPDRVLDRLVVGGESVAGAFAGWFAALPAELRDVALRWAPLPVSEFSARTAAAVAGCPVFDAGTALRALAGACLLAQPRPGRYRWHPLVRRFLARTRESNAGVARVERRGGASSAFG
ncbi:AfsR/SARP family transcriptional regulator [Saccharothrix coeruleofusca]|uniref:DNA-binding SARP family transcriptional activator n=1 Tax=Saccharothrix coeruleofusca TaxID=33919 RepID=A0A918ALB2_9PSEU|nr:AfsR/SARP family transcriptional regulator [Saccharothrix coeruleofusca]MBP2336563.1 DNA-binding SARP family transcriptional activator [Saccharothrix coeruleofusca]GGP52124.1 hypothetical protein GCM10010185_25250 [Saccharothrix coeruleofusca]